MWNPTFQIDRFEIVDPTVETKLLTIFDNTVSLQPCAVVHFSKNSWIPCMGHLVCLYSIASFIQQGEYFQPESAMGCNASEIRFWFRLNVLTLYIFCAHTFLQDSHLPYSTELSAIVFQSQQVNGAFTVTSMFRYLKISGLEK